MNINGYNPYKKGFAMLVADIEHHTADQVDGDIHGECAREIARLRRIEHAAVLAVDSEEWAGDAFHERMGLLMDALRGE
jgi:hypothetical protein